jgi:rubrerythrin
MYPGMAKSARSEGFDEIADWFETLAKAERSHANRFQKHWTPWPTEVVRRDRASPRARRHRARPHWSVADNATQNADARDAAHVRGVILALSTHLRVITE